jgi:hypothetical protein
MFGYFISGKIDTNAALKMMTQPHERGGIGIDEKDARKIMHTANKVIDHASDIKRFRKQQNEAHTFFNQHELAERLRDHLLNAYRMRLSKKQDDNLVELIADRVVGVSGEIEFNARIMEGVHKGGLALSEKEADDVTRYFEKVIAQGVDVSYKA